MITRSTKFADLYDWLTVEQSAAYSGKTPWTIYQLIHRGVIPHRRLGKNIQIHKSYFDPSNAKQQVTGVTVVP